VPKHSLEDFLGYVLVAALTIPLAGHIIMSWPNISRLRDFPVAHEHLSSVFQVHPLFRTALD
jgi:hypothetical protein